MYSSKLIVKGGQIMRRIKLMWCFVFACWLLPSLALAQFTETKEISKHFKISPETQIEISNKYGKIDIKNWDKDSLVFEIKIKVEAKKLSKLEESVKGIDFDITHNEHFVIVRTGVDKNKNSLGKEIQRFKETILKSDGNIQVDYTVWMPNTNSLKIDNKFGDIYVGDYHGKIDISLSNGNLKAHDFKGETNLTMSFADANINSMIEGQLDCNFSEMYIKEADLLQITSKSSDFEFNNIRELDIESRRDKFRIKKVDTLKNKSSFSIFRIDEFNDQLTFRSEYGSIELEHASPDFSRILIESKSTDINLYFNEEANFGFDFTLSDLEHDFCEKVTIENEEVLDEKTKKVKSTGYFGKKSDMPEKLTINAVSGELKIRIE